MNKKIIIILISIIVLAAGFFAATQLYQSSKTEKLSALAQGEAELFMPEHSPVWGNKDADVIVTEFLDPECESCRAFYPYVKELLESYGNKVALVIRYVPFHGNSKMVIKILEASRRQNLYWETLELLFKYQPNWGDHHNPRPELIWTFLNELNLDIPKLKQDMQDPSIEDIINKDFKDAQALGVRGTPTFFVNGKEPENFGMKYLKNAIDEQLAENN